MRFLDDAFYDEKTKTVVSVRDGVQKYAGAELGIEPYDKIFTVYRSPETIEQISKVLDGVVITDNHIELENIPADKIIGYIENSQVCKFMDENTNSTVAIKNSIKLKDNVIQLLTTKNQLSLGYFSEVRAHDKYDFEQFNIRPHHLAIVDSARGGLICKFRDALSNLKERTMMLLKKDSDVNIQKIGEVLKDLPEAIKVMSVEDLDVLIPFLEEAIKKAREKTPQGLAVKVEESTKEEIKDTENKEVEELKIIEDFKDSQSFKDMIEKVTMEKVSIVLKAKNFLDENYDFNQSSLKIMRDALKTQHKNEFKDEEIKVAFKLLEKARDYSNFGAPAVDTWNILKNKDL